MKRTKLFLTALQGADFEEVLGGGCAELQHGQVTLVNQQPHVEVHVVVVVDVAVTFHCRVFARVGEAAAAASLQKRFVCHEVCKIRPEVGKVRHEVCKVRDEVDKVRHEEGKVRHEVGKVRHEVGKVRHEVEKVRHEVGKVHHEVDTVRHEVCKVRHEVERFVMR